MYNAPDMRIWTGRIDAGPPETSRRWHQCVTPLSTSPQPPGIALLGVASDAGVQANQGRVGALAGPEALRRVLANQAFHLPCPVYDAGTLCCELDNLAALQEEQAVLVQQLLDQNHFPLLLGGGHEIAFGSFVGLERHLAARVDVAPIGIINFDAHFDLRSAATPTSGTPFLQIYHQCRAKEIPFHYCCLGISEVANTKALFVQAEQLGVLYLKDEELNSWQLPQAEQRLKEFIRPCQAIYLSIDLDVLPAATAPGVSAPASRGVPLAELEHLVAFIRSVAQNRLKLADIAEYNPSYDLDGRTARVAARLCHLLTRKA